MNAGEFNKKLKKLEETFIELYRGFPLKPFYDDGTRNIYGKLSIIDDSPYLKTWNDIIEISRSDTIKFYSKRSGWKYLNARSEL